jgi:DNA-directed RNA polymerase subunit RPC12/RpoP
MKPEILAEIKRRRAEMLRRIASGEIKVCSKANPMPTSRDIVGQKWFHEEARCESDVGVDTATQKNRMYHCPACGLRFPVTLKKIEVRA